MYILAIAGNIKPTNYYLCPMMGTSGNIITRFAKRTWQKGIYDAIMHTFLYLQLHLLLRCSCHIRSNIPKSSYLPHPVGIVVGQNVRIGNHVHVYQNVTLTTGVTIEDNARILAGAIILNKSTVGRGAVIGAQSIVLEDVEDNSVVAGVPASALD